MSEVRDRLIVHMSDDAARTTLACLYDRRAALIDHVSRADERGVGDWELEFCERRLHELDEAITAVRAGRGQD